jgi:hypothetical protein
LLIAALKLPAAAALLLLVQWSHKVRQSQQVLGSLYERIYDIIRSRGVPPAEETILWACLARIKDPATGWSVLVMAKTAVCLSVHVVGQSRVVPAWMGTQLVLPKMIVEDDNC